MIHYHATRSKPHRMNKSPQYKRGGIPAGRVSSDGDDTAPLQPGSNAR